MVAAPEPGDSAASRVHRPGLADNIPSEGELCHHTPLRLIIPLGGLSRQFRLDLLHQRAVRGAPDELSELGAVVERQDTALRRHPRPPYRCGDAHWAEDGWSASFGIMATCQTGSIRNPVRLTMASRSATPPPGGERLPGG